MIRFSFLTTTALLAMACAGCSTPASHSHGGGGDGMDGHMASMKGKIAVASLTPTQGNNVRGLFVFHQMGDHVMVHAQVSGLKPNAEHGIHVHEKGDCASADGTSAGGHFNPDGKPHGPQDAAHHSGDMPALKADANGVANQKFMLMGPTVTAGTTSLVEHAVIVHASPDDYTTQPTGNSGARIACGVIARY
ncbi:superoxide dismutase family protein [Ideonella sp.]|uniref:superoxide dismutase family protein n=1 Tax=Ideonella sp. TaxID=1929293 RepID=UPI0035AE19A7